MSIWSSPWFPIYAGTAFILLYSIGQYGRSRYGEVCKYIGMAGTGFILLRLFWGTCAVPATYFALILLGAAIGSRLLVWLYYRLKSEPNSDREFSFGSGRGPSGRPSTESTPEDSAAQDMHEKSHTSP